jgi:hypothetical protein
VLNAYQPEQQGLNTQHRPEDGLANVAAPLPFLFSLFAFCKQVLVRSSCVLSPPLHQCLSFLFAAYPSINHIKRGEIENLTEILQFVHKSLALN